MNRHPQALVRRCAVLATSFVPLMAACGPDSAADGPAGESPTAEPPGATDYPAMITAADYARARAELSNWGRWGPDDELGAANLITPGKRAAAAGLVSEGITVSLAHDIVEEEAVDATSVLEREVLFVTDGAAMDRLSYTGSYHGVIHSHLDAVACHIMSDGVGYDGVSREQIEEAGACPRASIHALRDGVVTRGVLFDATLLPEMGTAEGWVEPGTSIRAADLLRLEEIQGVRVEPGDVILLHTGRWIRREALGPWPTSDGVAGYHADVAWFLADRGVSFIGHDMWQDAYPQELSEVELLPLHQLALVQMGVGIFDNLDLGALAETAAELGRYEFFFTAAPLRIRGGMGSPLNPLAIF